MRYAPSAVNDRHFACATGVSAEDMNACGGGTGLFTGCAAGGAGAPLALEVIGR
jgi:hypothetical protein